MTRKLKKKKKSLKFDNKKFKDADDIFIIEKIHMENQILQLILEFSLLLLKF